jgi:hypothetical protein
MHGLSLILSWNAGGGVDGLNEGQASQGGPGTHRAANPKMPKADAKTQ